MSISSPVLIEADYRNKRRYVQNTFTLIIAIVILAISAGVIESFFISTFAKDFTRMNFFSSFSKHFKETTLTGVVLFNILNSLRARIINDIEVQEYNFESLKNYTAANIFSSIDKAVESYLNQPIDEAQFSPEVFKRMQFILTDNLCSNVSFYKFFKNRDECEHYENGIGKTGLQLLLPRISMEFREAFSRILENEESHAFSKKDIYSYSSLTVSSTLIREIFIPSQQILVTELINGIGEQNSIVHSEYLKTYTAMYGILALFAIIAHAYLIRKIWKELRSSMNSITILPMQVIMRVGHIKAYISSQIFT